MKKLQKLLKMSLLFVFGFLKLSNTWQFTSLIVIFPCNLKKTIWLLQNRDILYIICYSKVYLICCIFFLVSCECRWYNVSPRSVAGDWPSWLHAARTAALQTVAWLQSCSGVLQPGPGLGGAGLLHDLLQVNGLQPPASPHTRVLLSLLSRVSREQWPVLSLM